MRRNGLAVAVLASMLVTAACGSTVRNASSNAAGNGLDARRVSAGGVNSNPTADASTSGTPTAASGSVAAPSAARAGSSSDSRTNAAAVKQAPNAPVEIGIVIYPDVSAFAAKFGGTASVGDQKVEADAAVAWANAHGGLAGHKIVPVYYEVQLTSATPYDATEQQICSTFTADHHVVAATTAGANVDNVMPDCLKSHHVLYLTNGDYMHDGGDWQQFPLMYSPPEADISRVGATMVREILQRGFAKKGDRVGLMVMEEPGGIRTADNIVKPMLQAAGVATTEYTVPYPSSTPDIANSVAIDQSAALKMASQQIKTILFLCPGCLSFFEQNAASQHYYPRYIFTSLDSPVGAAGSSTPEAWRSAFGIGWKPTKDVTGSFGRAGVTGENSTRDTCAAIEKATGQVADDTSYWASQVLCDTVLTIWQAGQKNPAQPVTGDSLARGADLFGSGFPSAMNFLTNVASGRHGGVAGYRAMRWDDGCTCFVYDGAVTPLS